jgi:hypothetical protein
MIQLGALKQKPLYAQQPLRCRRMGLGRSMPLRAALKKGQGAKRDDHTAMCNGNVLIFHLLTQQLGGNFICVGLHPVGV